MMRPLQPRSLCCPQPWKEASVEAVNAIAYAVTARRSGTGEVHSFLPEFF
jgi:hypothetical protein